MGGMGSGEGEGGLFLRFRLVYILILSLLLSLESLEKFVWWFQILNGEVPEIIWCVNLVFSLSVDQAEQKPSDNFTLKR